MIAHSLHYSTSLGGLAASKGEGRRIKLGEDLRQVQSHCQLPNGLFLGGSKQG